ncbi:MAG TPA: DNA methyltransferase [Verrucomicrobiae bacterium]|nr:DNA methyltransferase [Verrucomicrobiae bacterium]
MLEASTRDVFLEAVHSKKPVVGLSHGYYRYPARFSPQFVRAAIKAFTKPGETVFDPFMGGGTTLVEASALGRRAIGTDINSLAVFISEAKTTVLSDADLLEVRVWAYALMPELNLHNPPAPANRWAADGYHRNISGRRTWPIRKTLELALGRLRDLRTAKQRCFARCVLLKTAQWALDCRKEIPKAVEFRRRFLSDLNAMSHGAREYAHAVRKHGRSETTATCLPRSVVGIEFDPAFSAHSTPTLVLTSPPYPGVHILYHRWQIQGRKETPAAYWIANGKDGSGTSFYTFGDRHEPGLKTYFDQLSAAFKSVARVASQKTLVVQMVAFSDPTWQLPMYLRTMESVGFTEKRIPELANSDDGRLWRSVPNRKWYANRKGTIASSKEVVLFHKLA